MQEQGSRHRTKIDAWLLAILVGAMVFSLADMLFVLVTVGPLPIIGVIVVLMLAIWAGVFSMIFPLFYEVTSSTLLIRSGWLRRRIPLNSIVRVFPTRNPRSAPALSLDRLQVEYLQGGLTRSVLISPQDKSSFLLDLAMQDGDLYVQGEQLIRR